MEFKRKFAGRRKTLIMSGCYDQTEIEQTSYTMKVGGITERDAKEDPSQSVFKLMKEWNPFTVRAQ